VALLLAAVLLVAAELPCHAACGGGGTLGDVHELYAGSEFWAVVPPGAGPWPLVVALHGDYGSPVGDGVLAFWQRRRGRGHERVRVAHRDAAVLVVKVAAAAALDSMRRCR